MSTLSTRTAAPGAPVVTRQELLYLLTRASELEHNLACVYLYAGYSLKSDVDEGGVTEDELEKVRDWKRKLAHVAVEEMLHLAQVANILTAVGGAPHFGRSNFPLPATTYPFGIALDLKPFSTELIDRLVCYEMPEEGILTGDRAAYYEGVRNRVCIEFDHREACVQNATEPFDVAFRTVGEFYKKIESAFSSIPEHRLFIGPPESQANPAYLDLRKELIKVTDAASARRAIEMIIEQGESPTSEHPDAHFFVFDKIRTEYEQLSNAALDEGRLFDPVRPMIENPTTRGCHVDGDVNRITDPVARELAELFNSCYDLMLHMLVRFFAHGEESEDEYRLLARGTLRIMASVLRPLGEALAKTPAGTQYPGKTAGPNFGLAGGVVHLLAHKRSAWIFFLERLYDLAMRLTRLSDQTVVPDEVQEAAAALESVAEHLTPFIPEEFAEPIRAAADERSRRTTIRPELDGPYIVRNLRKFTNSKGEDLAVRPLVALCRCGGSNIKPYCDGTHARNGFSSAKSPDRKPDRLDRYEGDGIVVRDNRGTCCHFGNCTNCLPQVFHEEGDVFVTPDGAGANEIVDIVKACPSGALGYARDGVVYEGEEREPAIYVAENASYYITGGIELEGEIFNKGASHEHYVLCRCGQSKNKPFCDGTHWWIQFRDEAN